MIAERGLRVVLEMGSAFGGSARQWLEADPGVIVTPPGGADTGIPNEHVAAMQEKLKAAGKPSEIVLYPETPHAFFADYRPSYREAVAKDGWAKLVAWFKKHGVE